MSAPELQPVKSAARVLDILELLSDQPEGLTISEISAQLGIARSSTHGLVHTLLQRRYLSVEPRQKTFRLGVKVIQLGLSVVDRIGLRAAARGPLEGLVALAAQTAFLAVPEGGKLVYVDKVIGTRDLRIDARLGQQRPLHCTSLGKALLAALDDDSLVAALPTLELEAQTPFTITDPERLLEDLVKTRKRGYSLDVQEAVLGVSCVGAPVRDHEGQPIAAINISAAREFLDARRFGPAVRVAAVEISQALGWRGDETTLYAPVEGTADVIFRDPRQARDRGPKEARRGAG